ncbi:hypothetical protein GCM10010304_75240 [Streptomyces roseoviolaceus]
MRDDVRPWRYPPTCDFLYGDWLREECERGVTPGSKPSPDLAPLLTLARIWATLTTGDIRSKDAEITESYTS